MDSPRIASRTSDKVDFGRGRRGDKVDTRDSITMITEVDLTRALSIYLKFCSKYASAWIYKSQVASCRFQAGSQRATIKATFAILLPAISLYAR